MFGRRNNHVYECVAVDLNTQRDYCDPDGLCPVGNTIQLVPALQSVMGWIRRNRIPVISSVESHRRWEVPRNGHPVHCCIDGTPGQRKLDFTIFPARIYVEADNTLAVSSDLFAQGQQVVFRKRTDDLLANPKADRFLTHLTVKEYIVFGNGLESAVKALVLGLLARNKRVLVVLDACGFWDYSTANLAVRQMAAKGAELTTVAQLILRRVTRRAQFENCEESDSNGNGKSSSNHGRSHYAAPGSGSNGSSLPDPS
jgi:nicotinamidase-related amidase